jgi:hypothetical protein
VRACENRSGKERKELHRTRNEGEQLLNNK